MFTQTDNDLNTSPNNNIPIVILIFQNNGETLYRAYSPLNYRLNNECNGTSYQRFIANVYNDISYNANTSLTRYGILKEIHTRYLDTPLTYRDNIIFFSTFSHPLCNYKPVHKESPLFFNCQDSLNYIDRAIQLHNIELSQLSCSHELL